MNLTRFTVLILSSDPAFSRAVTEAWPAGVDIPDFVVLKEDLYPELRRDTYDIAIVDAASRAQSEHMSQALVQAGKPAIMVHSDLHPHSAVERTDCPSSILPLNRELDEWPALAGMLGAEILRRSHAEMRADEAERICASAQTYATLGRYMVEMRHTTTNAITSILGNAELLLHEPGLPATVLSQADTVRNMALRLHEVFQRFFSLEKELSVAARESGKETFRVRGAGS